MYSRGMILSSLGTVAYKNINKANIHCALQFIECKKKQRHVSMEIQVLVGDNHKTKQW